MPVNPRTSRFAQAFAKARTTSLRRLLRASGRGRGLTFPVGPLDIDFATTHLQPGMLAAVRQLAVQCGWPDRFEAMQRGAPVNSTEGRAVGHLALRMIDRQRRTLLPPEMAKEFNDADRQLKDFVDAFHAGRIRSETGRQFTAILHIGIGGGALGPQLVVDALEPYALENAPVVRLCANVDPQTLDRATQGLDPKTTLIIYCSKSWTTRESRLNLDRALAWAKAGGVADPGMHVVAVTAKPKAARDWGALDSHILPQPESIGGRYSVMSAVGVAVALRCGWACFAALRKGAAQVDNAMLNTAAHQNPVVLAAMLGWGYASLWGRRSRAVFAYDDRLKLLVPYLQQLELESLGKGVHSDGRAVRTDTAPILWGGTGTTDQHSVFQLLHQGTEWVPLDFILMKKPRARRGDALGMEAARTLYANGIAQTTALAQGQTRAEAESALRAEGLSAADARRLAPHKVFAGNRPSLLIEADDLTPQTLGALIAFYEHRTFVQGLLWDINPYDQMGVELGKVIAATIETALDPKNSKAAAARARLDPVTRHRLG